MHTYACTHNHTMQTCIHIPTHTIHTDTQTYKYTNTHYTHHTSPIYTIPHTYLHKYMKHSTLRSVLYGFHLGLLGRNNNVKHPYSIFRKTKPLFCVLDLVAFKTKCMQSFITHLTLPHANFGIREIPSPPSLPAVS